MKRTKSNSAKAARTISSRDLVITRVFDAPVELVWKAWTEPERIKKWWGPKNYTAPVIKVDFKVGGKALLSMRGPDGKDVWTTGTYKEIVPLKRIVTTDSFADKNGKVVPSTAYGMSGFPLELQVTITFQAQGNRTKMTLRHSGLPSGKLSEMTGVGWNESFDKLEVSLASALHVIAEPGKQEIVMTRTFDAPRKLVFSAFTDPKLIPQWWGPRALKTIVDKMDVRFGGTWRYIHRTADGSEYAFHGVYHQVQEERIVDTFEYEGMPGHVMLETIDLEEHNGKTKMINTSVFQSIEDRDGMLHSGMERGATETMDRFSELLVKLGKESKRGNKK